MKSSDYKYNEHGEQIWPVASEPQDDAYYIVCNQVEPKGRRRKHDLDTQGRCREAEFQQRII